MKRYTIWGLLLIACLTFVWQVSHRPTSSKPPVENDSFVSIETDNASEKLHGNLPPVEQPRYEPQLQAAVHQYVQALENKVPPEKLASISVKALEQIATTVQQNGHSEHAAVYKYPVRFMLEQLAEIDGQALTGNKQLHVYTSGTDTYAPAFKTWSFGPYDNACYQILFNNNDAKKQLWSLKTFLAVRSRDQQASIQLHKQAGFPPGPQWPIEVYRQLFTYASDATGTAQLHDIQNTIPHQLPPTVVWAEIGYGSGKVFSALRQYLGQQASIIGVEIEFTCYDLVVKIRDSKLAAWGGIRFISGTYTSTGLGKNSVDVIHGAGLHVGDGGEQVIETSWLPWLASAHQALKPGGLLIVDDGGSPDIATLRKVMTRAKFKEVRYYLDSRVANKPQPPFCASFTPLDK